MVQPRQRRKRWLDIVEKKVNMKENVVFQTDKSGRFSVDSLENYKSDSQPHVAESLLVTKE